MLAYLCFVYLYSICIYLFILGWSSVYGYNMACLKNYVMREPLVDTVDKRQICTDHFPLKVQQTENLLIEKKIFFIIRQLIWRRWLLMTYMLNRSFDFAVYAMIIFMHLSFILSQNLPPVHKEQLLVPVKHWALQALSIR